MPDGHIAVQARSRQDWAAIRCTRPKVVSKKTCKPVQTVEDTTGSCLSSSRNWTNVVQTTRRRHCDGRPHGARTDPFRSGHLGRVPSRLHRPGGTTEPTVRRQERPGLIAFEQGGTN